MFYFAEDVFFYHGPVFPKVHSAIHGINHYPLDSAIGFPKCTCIEWFSFECRKTKTKVITLANHIGHRQYIEPIKTRSNYMWLTQSAGKCMRARHNWLWSYF